MYSNEQLHKQTANESFITYRILEPFGAYFQDTYYTYVVTSSLSPSVEVATSDIIKEKMQG